jgi:hypothetical protein
VKNEANDGLELFEALESERIRRMIGRDCEGLARVLCDSLMYGHSNGIVDDKASLLRSIADNLVQYVRIESRLDHIVWISPRAAAISGWLTTDVILKQQSKSVSGRYLAIWVQAQEHWQLQALQGSNAPK